MDKDRLKKCIMESIIKMHSYLKEQGYYEDINSYALYTDDGYMSLSMLFNTSSYLDEKWDDIDFLTYKFSSAEWYSEIIKNDVLISNNSFFNDISCLLRDSALSGEDNEALLINTCLEVLKDFRNSGEITNDKILLFMVSDNYDADSIIRWNSEFNNPEIISEINKWVS